jgi:hypothetical protein
MAVRSSALSKNSSLVKIKNLSVFHENLFSFPIFFFGIEIFVVVDFVVI